MAGEQTRFPISLSGEPPCRRDEGRREVLFDIDLDLAWIAWEPVIRHSERCARSQTQ